VVTKFCKLNFLPNLYSRVMNYGYITQLIRFTVNVYIYIYIYIHTHTHTHTHTSEILKILLQQREQSGLIPLFGATHFDGVLFRIGSMLVFPPHVRTEVQEAIKNSCRLTVIASFKGCNFPFCSLPMRALSVGALLCILSVS